MFDCLRWRLNDKLGSKWDVLEQLFFFGKQWCSWLRHYFVNCQKAMNKEENIILFEVGALSVLDVFWARKKSTRTFHNTSECTSPDLATGDLNTSSLSDCLLEVRQRQGEVYETQSSSGAWDTRGHQASTGTKKEEKPKATKTLQEGDTSCSDCSKYRQKLILTGVLKTSL